MSATVATASERRVAAGAVLGSAALFGTSGTARVLLQPTAPAAGAAAARLIVGAAGLVAWAARSAEGREALVRLWRQPIIWIMGVTVAAYQIFFFLSMSRTGVAVGTLASLALTPFMAGILGWIMREGAPGYVWLASTFLAIVGVTLLTIGAGDGRDILGIAFGLAAGASYAFYTVFGVRFARQGEQPTHVLAASFAISGVLPHGTARSGCRAADPGLPDGTATRADEGAGCRAERSGRESRASQRRRSNIACPTSLHGDCLICTRCNNLLSKIQNMY